MAKNSLSKVDINPMRELVLSIACFTSLFAAALGFAGMGALIAFDDAEVDDFARRYGPKGKLNGWSQLGYLLRGEWYFCHEMIARLSTHWHARSDARSLILSAVAFAVVAIGTSWWLVTMT